MRISRYRTYPDLDAVEAYVINGDAAGLSKVPHHPIEPFGTAQPVGHPAAGSLLYELPPMKKWADADRRALTLILRTQPKSSHLEDLYRQGLDAAGDDAAAADAFREAWEAGGGDRRSFRLFLLSNAGIPLLGRGKPTNAGGIVLEADDAELFDHVAALRWGRFDVLTALLAAARPDSLGHVVEGLLHGNPPYFVELRDPAVATLLKARPDLAARVAAFRPDRGDPDGGIPRLRELFLHDRRAFREPYEAAVREMFRGDHLHFQMQCSKAVADDLGDDAFDSLVIFSEEVDLSQPSLPGFNLLANLGKRAIAPLLAVLDRTVGFTAPEKRPWMGVDLHGARAALLERLRILGIDGDRLLRELEHAAANAPAETLPTTIRTAAAWDPDAARPLLLDLLKHKSKPVRLAAARAIGRGADTAEILAEAKKLLPAKKADTRTAAILVLGGIAGSSPEAVAALEEVLDIEDVDDVRDAALRELAALDRQAGRTPTKPDVLARIDKAEARGRLDPAALPDWLDAEKLPGATWADGEQLTDREIVYLLHRQSRAKEIVADLEVAPMYALLGDTAELAEAVLRAFLASKVDAKDRWALAVAGLLGDDRIVQPLKRAALEWPAQSRGKMAEYALQALGLIGTDTALSAVDEAARRFESKQKNVGRAAVEALQAAAEARGVSLDELGDGIVPWLGFEDGPRTVDCGGVPFEISVGPDLKFRYRNLEKDKVVKSLPKSVDPALKQELKVAAVTLREVGKAQVRRMENLMVQQRRWPADAWERLFLHHPILRPLATRLVWAGYDGDTPTPVFRPLADGTLTDTEDEAVELPADADRPRPPAGAERGRACRVGRAPDRLRGFAAVRAARSPRRRRAGGPGARPLPRRRGRREAQRADLPKPGREARLGPRERRRRGRDRLLPQAVPGRGRGLPAPAGRLLHRRRLRGRGDAGRSRLREERQLRGRELHLRRAAGPEGRAGGGDRRGAGHRVQRGGGRVEDDRGDAGGSAE